jgi:hypothetical protein
LRRRKSPKLNMMRRPDRNDMDTGQRRDVVFVSGEIIASSEFRPSSMSRNVDPIRWRI